MADPSPYQKMNCPYNIAHEVERYRMHLHLQKCRKQYHNLPVATCPFDATHIVNEVELDFHVSVCTKREFLDTQMYAMDDGCRPQLELVQPSQSTQSSATSSSAASSSRDFDNENWDNDAAQPYKPDPTKKAAHIIMRPRGATPSERRRARMEGIKNYKPPGK